MLATTPRATRLSLCLALGALLGAAGPALAQLMSKWGHPVVTFGLTPYDSINTGHGNYPGGPGFIPGYGYYPGDGPGHYPWMDGPGTPFDRRKIVPLQADPLAGGSALIIVKVPEEAELWFDETKTAQGGSYREFLTPPLPAGQRSSYTLRVKWLLKDMELTRVETVAVLPGETCTVNFLTVDSWTGKRAATLPPPRNVP